MIGVGMKGFEGWFVAELQFRVITVVPVALGLRGGGNVWVCSRISVLFQIVCVPLL
jgi:hypothetical protein